MTKRRAEQSADALYWDAAGSGSTMKKQRCCGASASLCGVNTHLDGMAAAATARMLDPLDPLDPPSLLLAVLGSRCRKRPYYYNNYNNNDPPEQHEGAAQRRKTCSHADMNRCVSQQTDGSFPDLHSSSTRSDHHHHNKRLRPDDEDDGDVSPQSTTSRPDGGVTRGDADRTGGDLCTFNSFQYWRVPLPVIDQSLLEDMNSQSEPREKAKDKGCSPPDAMET